MATASFEAAGHAPTSTATLSSSASAFASASASASASAFPSSSLLSQSIAFYTPSVAAAASADSPNFPHLTHTHRQNHNSSKLPAFRFADFKNQSPRLALPSLLQHIPPSPVSPKSGSNENDSAPTATVADIGIDNTTGTAIDNTGTANDAVAATTPTTAVTATSDQPHQNDISSDTSPHRNTRSTSLQLHHDRRPSYRQLSPRISSPIDELPEAPPRLSPRSRASTYQTATHSTPATPAISPRRPISLPDSPVIVQASNFGVADSNTLAFPRLHTRSTVTSRCRESNAIDIETPPVAAPYSHPFDASDDVPSSAVGTPQDSAHGQRELLLPKTLQNSSPTDEKRKSVTSRPPFSFKVPSNSTSATSVRVAPIRSFRSSGSRRSLGLDCSTPAMRSFDFGDEFADSNHRDRTLRALEGRIDDDFRRMTPPQSATQADADDTTGDVFMKIARQEPSTRRGSADVVPAEESSAIARVTRFSHRRPLSAAVPLSYHPTSPPQISRRLSDQQETSKKRARQPSEDESAAEPVARALAYRSVLTRDRPASVHPGEDLNRSKTFHSATRSSVSANTPRSFTFQGQDSPDVSPYGRRRPSLTDSTTGYPSRSPAYRQSNLSYGQTRTYNSSPLVPKMETPRIETQPDAGNGLEGAESTATASTTAPSTVWDELDDLKSRIHRLELTGKLPATSGAAMSRASDERPPTATNTTMSTSPKRASGSKHPKSDIISTTSSQREIQQPLLLSAVNKSKPFLSNEVARALETAATEALALASMMGRAGQPGPISSGASTIGVGTNLTDRQLRRKADSICRSLTDLVLALSEENARDKTLQVNVPTPKDATTPLTPTIKKTFTGGTNSSAASGATAQQRSSVREQHTVPKPDAIVTSPRALSQYEERRNTMLNSSALPSPRFALPPGTIPPTPGNSNKTAHRKSSLLIGRTRRAVTEEPEDGRRSSLLLRTRRAGSEEPEDSRETIRQGPRQESGRQTSLLRTRRGNIGEDDDEASRFRAPSRAVTDLHTPARVVSPTYHSNTAANEISSPASSTLPRRRFGASALTSRLVSPSTPSLSTRRYLERTSDRDTSSSAEKPEERSQPSIAQPRHISLSHTSLLNRTGSVSRRPNRDSMITNTSTAAQTGSFR